MAEYADEHERTMAFAEIALGQIKALRQAATPRNYEIWYAYATGYLPSLNQKINETLKNRGVLAEANLDNIYATYLSPTRLTERIDEVGSQVKGEIEQVMSMIDSAAGSANSYTESLAGMSEDRPVEGPRRPAHHRRKPGAHRQGDGTLQHQTGRAA
jgi:diguanylate cyclase